MILIGLYSIHKIIEPLNCSNLSSPLCRKKKEKKKRKQLEIKFEMKISKYNQNHHHHHHYSFFNVTFFLVVFLSQFLVQIKSQEPGLQPSEPSNLSGSFFPISFLSLHSNDHLNSG